MSFFLRRLIRKSVGPGLFLSLLLCHGAWANNTVLVLGDSISAAYGMDLEQGWVALLEQRIAEQYPSFTVVNASISGETTVGGKARLPALLEKHDPRLLIIELGGNDGLAGHPLGRMRANLASMTQQGIDSGAAVLLVTMDLPPNYAPEAVRERFRATYREVAKKAGAAYTPSLFDAIATDPALMQRDNIHPTAAAQPILLDQLWPSIEAQLKALTEQTR